MAYDSPVCDFGWKAAEFSLSDPNGVQQTLSDSMREKGLLIAFICNHCPYVQAIIDRFVTDATVLMEEGIGVVAIMPNDYINYPADKPSEMLEFAKMHAFNFPYLVDETQTVAKSYNAVCTPDFFGFNKDFELNYRGRLDDARTGDASNRTPELLNAMRQVAETGHGPEQQFPSMGCSIKWRESA